MNMSKTKLIANEIIQEWDSAIGSDGLVFHSNKWINLLASTQRLKLQKIGFFLDGRLVGLVPIFTRNYWLIKVSASPFIVDNTPYMGVVVDDKYFEDALLALDDYLRKNRVDFVRLLFQKDYSNFAIPDGYTLVNKHTHLLELTDVNSIWKGLEGRCRTAIKKAEKHGVIVSVENNPAFIERYYAMCEVLYRKQKMKVPNQKIFYEKLLAEFSDNILMLEATMNGLCVGGAIILLALDRAYYLNGVSLQEYNQFCPNNLIQWKGIQLAMERGCNSYDFVGSDIERLAKFKKSFGGKLETYTCLEKSNSKVATLARSKYTDFKQIMGRLKNFISYSKHLSV